MKLLIINGPNLNLLGAREPQIYGHTALEAVLADLRGRFPQVEILHEQSNYQGRIIDLIQQAKVQGISGIVLNPGGYSHSSVAIADAIMARMERGVTGLNAVGMYSNTDRKMLFCVVSRKEIVQIREIVREFDTRAFVIVSDVKEVFGEGFIEY